MQSGKLPPGRLLNHRRLNQPRRKRAAPKKGLLKSLEAAEFLGMSKLSFYRLISGKQIPHYRIGSRILISQQQLSTWLASNESVSG
jgi:excisionase family DNA binding protein